MRLGPLYHLRSRSKAAGIKRIRCVGLERNELKPWKNKAWCILELSDEFVDRIGDVLDLYEVEYDGERPVVCFDETSKQVGRP